MFLEVSSVVIASHISSFHRPGSKDHSAPSTPSVGPGSAPPPNRQLDSLWLPSKVSLPATCRLFQPRSSTLGTTPKGKSTAHIPPTPTDLPSAISMLPMYAATRPHPPPSLC